MRTKKEVNVQIGEQIKTAREQARLTQEQLAESVEVSPQYISDLERGVVGVSLPTLKKICSCLCVSSDLILFGRKNESRLAAIAEQCANLTDEQFAILAEVVGNFVRAIQTERKKQE